jgi:glycosyltransferase involved in cell wall biosynthesis
MALYKTDARERICLNMIVKNESHVIKRCLDSVKDLIDYWVIVDTGSTDTTKEIIKECLKGIPGELFERPWKNFGYNRSEALEFAKEKCGYILFMDADDWLEYEPGFVLPPLTSDVYYIHWFHEEGLSYRKPQIIKACLPWRWVGVMHEYLYCDDRIHSESEVSRVKYIYGGDGASSKNESKYFEMVRVLQEGLKEEPNNERYLFYLAQSLLGAGMKREALEIYKQRVERGGWEEEVFWSLLQIAFIKHSLQFHFEEVIMSYLLAHRYCTHRAEPIYFLSEIYNQRGDFALAYACIKGWQALPKEIRKDRLFKLCWIEQYGLSFQLSLSAYYLGQYQEFLQQCDQLLALETLPENMRIQVEENKKCAEECEKMQAQHLKICFPEI